MVLLAQCFYYRGFTWKDEVIPPPKPNATSSLGEPNERTGLLHPTIDRERRLSNWSNVDVTHLSPATPLLEAPKASDPPAALKAPTTLLQSIIWNSIAVLMVCVAGFLGWWISSSGPNPIHKYKHLHSYFL